MYAALSNRVTLFDDVTLTVAHQADVKSTSHYVARPFLLNISVCSVSMTTLHWLMPVREITAVYSDKRSTVKNTM
jgi:hypothetical protein